MQPVLDSVVIGAGQAGLSASYHLTRRGLSHVALDANPGPGGAWQHRWDALTMRDVHRIAELPGADELPPSEERANTAVPAYFDAYERLHGLPVVRPVTVERVTSEPSGLLRIETDGDEWLSRTIVNATGTWTQPHWPHYPGQETFRGEQLHTHDFRSPERYRGRRVLVVGGGASAVQFLGLLAPITDVVWVTRREPLWRTGPFTAEIGTEVVARVEERVRAGLPPTSVVSVTGLALRAQEEAARQLGVYDARRPMFSQIEPDGVRWADGAFEPLDVILWATGFRPALRHLAPLHLRSDAGGIQLDRFGTTALADPRVQFVGYGPSASTIGANRAGRFAARGVAAWFDAESAQPSSASSSARSANPLGSTNRHDRT